MKFDRLEMQGKSFHAFYDIAVNPLLWSPSGPFYGGAYGLLADVATTMAICVIDPSVKKTVRSWDKLR